MNKTRLAYILLATAAIMVTILSYIPREPYVETVTNKVSEKEREELELYAISAVLMDGDR